MFSGKKNICYRNRKSYCCFMDTDKKRASLLFVAMHPVTVSSQVIANGQLFGFKFINGSKMLTRIYSFSPINIHLITTTPSNLFDVFSALFEPIQLGLNMSIKKNVILLLCLLWSYFLKSFDNIFFISTICPK